MPPQRLVFEGPTPESVILEACATHGPEVQLTAPERVRRGGMLGFFAQSAYRVQVMPKDGTLRDLAAIAERAPEREEHLADAVEEATTLDYNDVPADPFEALLDAEPDFDVELDTTAPHTFDEALALASGALGVDHDAQESDGFDALVARLRGDPTGLLRPSVRPLAGEPATVIRASDPVIDPLSLPTLGSSLIMNDLTEAEADNQIAPPPNIIEAIAASAPIPANDELGAQSDPNRVVAALKAVGFPTTLLASAAGRLPVGFSLAEVFATLPVARPLPQVAGSLIAIVGPESAALAHAARIATVVGLPADGIALARTTQSKPPTGRHPGRDRMTESGDGVLEVEVGRSFAPDLYVESLDQALDLSPGWRRDRVGVVAVEVATSLDAAPRARAMLRALRPSVTLMVADATQKSADIAFRANAFGGVDALLLHDLQATMTPAEVLSAEIPVARLDDAEPSPTNWVRIVEDALDRRSPGAGR